MASAEFLKILVPILYAAVVADYAVAFFTRIRYAEESKRELLLITLVAHLVYLFLRYAAYGHVPITNLFEVMTILAFAIALAYLMIERMTRVTETGFFVLSVALVFQTISSVFIKCCAEVNPVLRSPLLGFHVTSALLGYSAISISAVYGFLYLMLYHDIRSTRFSAIYRRLPSLEVLESMSFRATILGFAFLSLAILVGFIWLPRAFESFSYADPKLLVTVSIWLLYGIGFSARTIGRWQGRRVVILALCGFAIVFLSMTVVNVFFSGFHNFY
ncbi:MAG: cytochrome C biogenesis protein [Ignavibacteriales bacterium CG07_land_8_20_14_0_80_59_12]|nr:MAG: cytochrome C biogenesis protein [Ignavibacteriales bacterium CG07_land_8_20_14_0_80_59_12]